MNKQIFIYAITVLFLLSIVSNASAITGRLGNSRMVLTLDEGKTIERYILVQNFNDVPLTIELEATGDLVGSIKLREESFNLQPGEEKNAYFTITADKPGTTESKINVKFTPEEGSGVGLSSTIIVIAPGENLPDEEDDSSFFGFLGNDDEHTDNPEPGVDIGIGNNPNVEPSSGNSEELSTVSILTISTIILVLVFIVLLVYAKSRTKSKKRPKRPRV